MSEAYAELDALDPAADRYTFRNGLEAEIVPLQTRQLFRLLRILTHGAGMALQRNPIDFSRPVDEFGSQLAIMVLVSIPDAEEEALQFISSLVRPAGINRGSNLSKQERERNEAIWARCRKTLDNPDPEDLVDLIQFVIDRDKDHLLDLGKRLWAMAQPYFSKGTTPGLAENPTPEQVAEMTLTPETVTPRLAEPPSVQAGSPPPSTSSPASTGGPTSKSSTSRSGGSARSSTPSAPAAAPDSLPVPG